MNFRPVVERCDKKGTKPLPEPTSVPQVLLLMLVHLCRKVLFVDPSVKVAVYVLSVFFGSIIADVLPIPRTYFSRKDNVFNVFFVKWSWAWTMTLVGSFLYLTAQVYCCGNKARIRSHFIRLLLATLMWMLWTNLFVFVEESHGFCNLALAKSSRKNCAAKGGVWSRFSISGHTFILIYCTLIIMEEAKALSGWENIRDHLRNEEHSRSSSTDTGVMTPLDNLKQEQLDYIKEKYEKFTPYVRVIFITMTFLTIIWDVMLVSTVLYFHTTPEKFIASIISVLIWFFSYRFLFKNHVFGMLLPGEGLFRYMNPTATPLQSVTVSKAQRTVDKVPTFLGMPLNPLRNQTSDDATSGNSRHDH